MVRLFHVCIPARTLILVVAEAALWVVALVAAHMTLAGSGGAELLRTWAILRILLTTFVAMCCMHYFDLYDSANLQRSGHLVVPLVKAEGAACLLLAPVYYWLPAAHVSIAVFLTGMLMAGLLLLMWRRAMTVLGGWSRLSHPAVMVGAGPLLDPLLHELDSRAELGCHVVGLVHTGSPGETIPSGLADLGSIEDLPGLVERAGIQRVIVTADDPTERLPVEMLLRLKTHGVAVEDASDAYEAITEKVPPDALRGALLLSSSGFYIPRALRLYKRIGSILVSSLGLLITLPLQALIALALKLDSPGPAIFRQERIGKDGRPFVLFKFRTMVTDADPNKPAEKNDARCTRVGRWLRRTRLDELPQLFNILRGDMHLIGPRPFTRTQEAYLAAQIPFYAQRWAVAPGLTGWAQIHRAYCATLEDNIEKLSYDLFYIKNVSVGLDLVIFLQTIKTLLLARGSR